VEWIFFAFAAGGIFIFRKRYRDAQRPFRTPGYPVTPIIFIVIVIWFVFNIWINKPLHAEVGAGFLVLGLPIYFYFSRKNRNMPAKTGEGIELNGD